MRKQAKRALVCLKCGARAVRLRRFYSGPVQIVEGEHAGKYCADCQTCGASFLLRETADGEIRRTVPLGKGTGYALGGSIRTSATKEEQQPAPSTETDTRVLRIGFR